VRKLITRIRAIEREDGFTLPELIIAFIILALIVYAAFNLLDVNISAGNVYRMQADISQDLRETTGAMVDQIRTASTFTNAQSSNVEFTSYLMGTNDLYNVQFFLEGGNLIHRANTGELGEEDNKVLASNVTGFELNYFDSTSTVLGDPNGALEDICLVTIELTMTLSSGEDVMTDTMVTMVRVRR